MGTNYYLKCNDEKIHIGKKSKGYNFIWATYPEAEVYCIRDWLHFILVNELENNLIDEYDKDIEILEFFDKISAKEDGLKDHKEETGDENSFYDNEGNIFLEGEFE